MPHVTIQPLDAATYDKSFGKVITLPAGKLGVIVISFGTPLWENSGSVFDLDQNKCVAHANNHVGVPNHDPVGPFHTDHRLLVVAAHKDIDWDPDGDKDWHQNWCMVYREVNSEYWYGFNDAGVPPGNFGEAHVQIRIEFK